VFGAVQIGAGGEVLSQHSVPLVQSYFPIDFKSLAEMQILEPVQEPPAAVQVVVVADLQYAGLAVVAVISQVVPAGHAA